MARKVLVLVSYFSSGDASELVRAVGSFFDQIVIVDNSGDDNEWNKLSRLNEIAQHVRLVGSENEGFGAGVNRAFTASGAQKGDVLFVANPDIRVDEPALNELYHVVDSGEADVALPTLVTGEESGPPRYWYHWGSLSRWNLLVRMRRSAPLWRRLGVPREVNFVTGALFSIRAEAFELLGGFREHFFLYWEDADFSLRAADLGLHMVWVPGVQAWHQRGGSTRKGTSESQSAEHHYYMNRNRLLIAKNSFARVNAALLAGSIGTIVLLLRAAVFSDASIRAVRMAVAGVIDGLRGKAGPLRIE